MFVLELTQAGVNSKHSLSRLRLSHQKQDTRYHWRWSWRRVLALVTPILITPSLVVVFTMDTLLLVVVFTMVAILLVVMFTMSTPLLVVMLILVTPVLL